jgi:hypothetical protein
MKASGRVAVFVNGEERLIEREALRDLCGRFGGITRDAPEEEIIEYFESKIEFAAVHHPDVILTSGHFHFPGAFYW